MSTVLGEDDESSSSEGENETHQPLATHVPNIITGEDSEEEDTPHVGGAEGANMVREPRARNDMLHFSLGIILMMMMTFINVHG